MQDLVLIGFGFMGKTHADVYRRLPAVRVVGVVEPGGEAIREELSACGLGGLPVFADLPTAIGAVDFSVADICLPTDLHHGITLQALAAGKHVFCEKPIALRRDEAEAMTRAARLADRQLMIGHCIRFWPEYVELKRMADSGNHGRLVALSLGRRTGRPAYSREDWVNQPERCIGAALDLHIHDTDFLIDLLGVPKAVDSQALRDESGWSSIATHYLYDGCLVTAEGAWNYPANWGFQMRFSAVFERAVLDYDSRATDTLTLTLDNSAPAPIGVPPGDGYFHELTYFIDCLERGASVTINTGEQATASLEVVLAEIQSADSQQRITLTK